jgi:hypothetical protein
MYTCGHNIVFYDSNTKSQRFIPGIEGTQAITSIGVNNTKKIIAVCERGTQAICSIYQINKIVESIKQKKGSQQPVDSSIISKRKVLVMTESTATDFLSVEFCPQNEKLVATLSGAPDYTVALW